MSDLPSPDDPAPASPAPAKAPRTAAQKAALALVVVLVAVAVLGGAFVGGSVLGAVHDWPWWAASGLALLLGYAVPLFLAVRLHHEGRRRGLAPSVRRSAALVLLVVIQLAFAGAASDWGGATVARAAAAAEGVLLHTTGSIPVLSNVLRTKASREGIPIAGPDGAEPVGAADGGPASASDGGRPEGRSDAGVPAAPTVRSADAGPGARSPASGAGDRGVAPAPGADAGIGASSTTTGPLSRRESSGATVLRETLALSFDDGVALATLEVQAGGGTGLSVRPTTSVQAPLRAVFGNPFGAGLGVSVRGDALWTREQNQVRVLAELSRGAPVPRRGKGPPLELRAVRELALGFGGQAIAVIDAFDPAATPPAVRSAVVARGKKGKLALVRLAGDSIPDAAAGSVAIDFVLLGAEDDGTFLLVESFAEGGQAPSIDLRGERFSLPPERLLSGQLDQPLALVEVARTGDAVNGVADRSLQAVLGAVPLVDGTVLLDGNFQEKGRDGALMRAKPNGGVFALASGAPAPPSVRPGSSPRARNIDAEPEGGVGFLDEQGALVLVDPTAPARATTHELGLSLVTADGTPAGQVHRALAVRLGPGARWVLLHVEREHAGQRSEGLVLASDEDLARGRGEWLFGVGDPVGAEARGPVRTLRSAAQGKGRRLRP